MFNLIQDVFFSQMLRRAHVWVGWGKKVVKQVADIPNAPPPPKYKCPKWKGVGMPHTCSPVCPPPVVAVLLNSFHCCLLFA